ncbi:PIN domain-containing protein [Bacillus paranthracis]
MRVKQRSVTKRIVSIKEDVKKTPPELSEQFPFIREMLDAFNVPRYELENYEADDIMGTLAKEASEQGASVKVISGDKDLLQLVSDNTLVCIPSKRDYGSR